MRALLSLASSAVALLIATGAIACVAQPRTVPTMDEAALPEYAGVYQWDGDRNAFLYLQLWNELTGKNQLVALDESGEVRALFAGQHDHFFTGQSAGIATPVESRIEFRRDSAGVVRFLIWNRGNSSRVARRASIERHESVRFLNDDIQLAGTLITPTQSIKHPAIVLVHGSGAADRHSMLPFARFLVRRGIAVLGYDKRGVGASTGDWKIASFEDLAGDVTAAVEFLKTRPDIDARQIGLLGVSQAGWIMPLAAIRSQDVAFLISVSGAGVPAAETTIDHAQHEMVASGMKAETISQIVDLMKLQYEFARTGEGWDRYATTRRELAARLGRPPGAFPENPNDPYWGMIHRLYLYDPAPTLRRLKVPTLAIFGALDNNILAAKNKAAWDAAMAAAQNPDYTSVILPRANHIQLEAKVGNNAEMPSLQRFVPEYFETIERWLVPRVREE